MNGQPSAALLKRLSANPQAIIDACDKADAEESFAAFVRLAWPYVDTSEYVHNWHIDEICDHLQAVSEGLIQNLLMNIPPGHMKSILISVMFPCWLWISRPHLKMLFTSYSQSITARDSRACRNLIGSEWYQRIWGDRFQLLSDQNQKLWFANDRMGFRQTTTVRAKVTGERADIVVCDDPHNVLQAESDVIRSEVITWWREAIPNRINPPDHGDLTAPRAKIVFGQRVHQADLSEEILKMGGYDHVCLPARYEHDHPHVYPGDPRTMDGELLWPELYDDERIDSDTSQMGSYAAAGQYQQRPAPRSGGMFKRHWFAIAGEVPAGARRVRYWDLAATAPTPGRDPDWTVGVLMALKDGVFIIEDIRRERGTPHEVEQLVAQTAATDTRSVSIWMEQEPGASGKASIAHYQRNVLVGFAMRGERSTGSKELRAEPMSAAAEAGNVKLLVGDWNVPYLDEISVFPMGRHDDQADASSGAFNKLVTRRPAQFTQVSYG